MGPGFPARRYSSQFPSYRWSGRPGVRRGRRCGCPCGRRRWRLRTRRPTADYQHVKRRLRIELGGFARAGVGVELGENFLHAHAAGREVLAIQEYHRHRHDIATLDLFLEQCAVDDGCADIRVQRGQQVQRLNHVRAVVAGERHENFELQRLRDGADLLDDVGLDLGRMAADLQQRKDKGGNSWPIGMPANSTRAASPLAAMPKDGLRAARCIFADADVCRAFGNVGDHCAQLFARRAAVISGNEFDRALQAFQVSLELALDIAVQHDAFLHCVWAQRAQAQGCEMLRNCARLIAEPPRAFVRSPPRRRPILRCKSA